MKSQRSIVVQMHVCKQHHYSPAQISLWQQHVSFWPQGKARNLISCLSFCSSCWMWDWNERESSATAKYLDWNTNSTSALWEVVKWLWVEWYVTVSSPFKSICVGSRILPAALCSESTQAFIQIKFRVLFTRSISTQPVKTVLTATVKHSMNIQRKNPSRLH